MIKKILFALLFFPFCIRLAAQPGYSSRPLQFKVFYNGEDVFQRIEKDFVLEWQHSNSADGAWQKAFVQNSEFTTGNIDADHANAAVKIYRRGSADTMFINTSQSLHQIPFQPGHFVFDRHTAPLTNMKSFAGVKIVNQQWNYFKTTAQETLPVLPKQRYVYMSRDLYPHDIENDPDPSVQYMAFNRSGHIKETAEDGYKIVVELGQLYYAPAIASSVYCIGYMDDLGEEEIDYRPWLLESKDGCRSWHILFPVNETDAQLATISDRGFVFLRDSESKLFVTYNSAGKVVDSVTTADPCTDLRNIFSPCDMDTRFSAIQSIETSSPYMGGNSTPHLFHRRFTNDGVHFITLDVLPFYPNDINRTDINGKEERILELNAGDTYAYLTLRKNKLVLLSYNYTLVSRDFGTTWTYYRNGLLDGGAWNFIWLDDNTLVNVTQEYADVITIE